MKTANIKSEPSGKRRRRHRRWRKKKIGKSNLPCRRSENRWRKNSKLPRMLESKLNMSGDEFEGTCFSDTSTSLSSILIPNRTASHVQDSSPLELFLDIIISRVAAPSRDEYFFFFRRVRIDPNLPSTHASGRTQKKSQRRRTGTTFSLRLFNQHGRICVGYWYFVSTQSRTSTFRGRGRDRKKNQMTRLAPSEIYHPPMAEKFDSIEKKMKEEEV